MNQHQILKHNDGMMLAVVWPDQAYFINHESRKKALEEQKYYEKLCEQAIANGLPFNEQDAKELEITMKADRLLEGMSIGLVDLSDKEFPEKMKPYDLPEGIELEKKFWCKIYEHKIDQQCKWNNPNVSCRCKEFMFIKKHQPERKEETQHDLWKEALSDYSTITTKFRIERIK